MNTADKIIRDLVAGHRVVVFMKGTRTEPRCGFSARMAQLLDDRVEEFRDVDVLANEPLREAVKTFSSWPTLPQLYVNQTFVGGTDIVEAMAESGELDTVLAVQPITHEPRVRITSAAQAQLEHFAASAQLEEDEVLRLTIGAPFEPSLEFGYRTKTDVVVFVDKLPVHMTPGTARRARDIEIDFAETPNGAGFKVRSLST